MYQPCLACNRSLVSNSLPTNYQSVRVTVFLLLSPVLPYSVRLTFFLLLDPALPQSVRITFFLLLGQALLTYVPKLLIGV